MGGLRGAVRARLQQISLRAVLRRIQRSPEAVLSTPLFEILAWGWGNRAYVAEIEYLRGIGERARAAHGSILECGSGLSTLMTAALIEGGRTVLYALEHDRNWFEKIRAMVERLNFHNVRVLHAPLKDYGEFCWYDASKAELPRDISLVLCDGPPGDTKGGRYGLLPVMHTHLLPGASILVDDYKRAEERLVVDRWIGEFGGSKTVVGTRFPYAILTRD